MGSDTGPELRRVLHVDDDDSIRGVARLTLEKVGGFEVCSCATGQEALTRAAGFQPQLILLDVMMPDMDGPATLHALRSLLNLSKVPVLFMTAKVLPAEQQRLIELGAFGVIIKPFDPMQLPQQILGLWRRYHGC